MMVDGRIRSIDLLQPGDLLFSKRGLYELIIEVKVVNPNGPNKLTIITVLDQDHHVRHHKMMLMSEYALRY